MKKFLTLTFTILLWYHAQAQVTVASNVLHNDSTTRDFLSRSLDGLLSQLNKSTDENEFVLPSERLSAAVLLDELKDQRNDRNLNQQNYYEATVNNVVALQDHYLVQISFLASHEGKAVLRSSFTLAAEKNDNKFLFYSPLKYNTASWKKENISNFTIHYASTFKKEQTEEFIKTIEAYDKRLSAKPTPTEIYCADDATQVLKLIGVDFKSDYAGLSQGTFSGKAEGKHILVDGFYLSPATEKFDPHDLWHDRLHNVLSTDIINRPVDEGTAYLYGGSWGSSWEEVKVKFLTYVKENPKADWMTLYNESVNFDPKGKYPFKVDFMINALIIHKIEKEKGFPAVIELLSCGKKVKGNDNYFTALEKITGVNKKGFNRYVNTLVKQLQR